MPVSSDSTAVLATDTSVRRTRRVRPARGRLAMLRHHAAKPTTPAGGTAGHSA
jgi:hypothetical protein